MILSVKERILQQVKKNLESFTYENNNEIQFDYVGREELDESQQNAGTCISVIDGGEEFVYQTSYLLCQMRVSFDISCKIRKGDTPSFLLNAIFAELKKELLSDYNLIEDDTNAQLCENIQVSSYLPDPAGPNDDVATAFAEFLFLYRENKENPYQLM